MIGCRKLTLRTVYILGKGSGIEMGWVGEKLLGEGLEELEVENYTHFKYG